MRADRGDEIRRPQSRGSDQRAYACAMRSARRCRASRRGSRRRSARAGRQQDRHAVGGDDADGDPGRSGPDRVGFGHRRERRARQRGAVHLLRARERELRGRERSRPLPKPCSMPSSSRLRAQDSNTQRSLAQRAQIGGQGRLEAQRSPVVGWTKPSTGRVQRLAAESERGRPRRGRRRRRDRRAPAGRSTPGARGSGACGRSRAGRAAVSPRAASLRPRQCVTAARPRFARVLMRLRSVGWRPIGASTVPLAARGAPRTNARYSRSIECALHCAASAAVRAVVLRDDQHARGVLVEPVHDAGPQLAADAGEIPAVVKQRVHERSTRVAGRRMHDQTRGLVDDDQVRVLVQDDERDRLRPRRPPAPARARSRRSARPRAAGAPASRPRPRP